MKQTKLWLTTIAVLLCSITKVSGEIILTEEDGLLKKTWTNSAGVKQYVYTSPVFTLEEATNKLVFTFLEGHTTTNSLNDKNGYPFVALAEFYLHDGEGNRISLDASNFSTNAQEPKEGPLKNICDKNYSTFFHSMWSTGASDYHNITVTLPEGMELKEFQFKYYTRYTSQCVPKKISIRAGYETVADGTCGDNLTWRLTAGGDLAISGSGYMYDYNHYDAPYYDAPWYDYRASIKKVTINEGVTSIGTSAFANCTNLTSVDIANGVETIGYQAFFDTGIDSVYIPKSVWSIINCAFGSCNNLTSIVVDAENSEYDSRNGCNAIIRKHSNHLLAGCRSTIIPDGIVSIGVDAFHGHDNLLSINIPESVQRIEHRAFWDCDKLKSITIPKSVEFIEGQQVFGYCRNLATISVDAANPYFDSRNSCNAIIETSTNTIIRGTAQTVIPEDVKVIGDFAFSGCLPMKSFNIPEGVTSIGSYAFCQCNNLASISLPKSVESIGEYAFYNCYNLTSVELPQSVAEIKNYTFAYCSKLASVSFPDELKAIGIAAFYGCFELNSLTIPESLDTISDLAFYVCESLEKLIVPDGVAHIGFAAFQGCSKMKMITIGKNVKTIGDRAFNTGTALSLINSFAIIPPQILGNDTFYRVNTNTCQLNVPIGSKAAYQAADVWKDFSLISEKEELTSIEQLEASSTSVWPTNIYDMNGRLVRENAHSADGLTGGVYIINGRKVIIRD